MMSFEWEPLDDRLLVLPDEPEAVSRGGVIIPDSAKRGDRTNTGIVVAVGPGRVTDAGLLLPLSVRVGDHIVYPKGNGINFDRAGVQHKVLREEEVLARLED